MGYDEEILKHIKNKFRSVKEISELTGINKSRVTIKLHSLLKYGLVISMQGQSNVNGPKPLLYKKN